MEEAYDIFDRLLIQHGNDAYSAIKLVEALASEKMVELAQETRPLVPPMERFSAHLDAAIEEATVGGPELRAFRDLLNVQRSIHVTCLYGA